MHTPIFRQLLCTCQNVLHISQRSEKFENPGAILPLQRKASHWDPEEFSNNTYLKWATSATKKSVNLKDFIWTWSGRRAIRYNFCSLACDFCTTSSSHGEEYYSPDHRYGQRYSDTPVCPWTTNVLRLKIPKETHPSELVHPFLLFFVLQLHCSNL